MTYVTYTNYFELPGGGGNREGTHKNSVFLVVGPLRGQEGEGGGKTLGPLRKNTS